MQKERRRSRVMTLPSRRRSARHSAFSLRSAFTLMEVLVVIALLGLVAAVVTTDFAVLLDGARTPSAHETLRKALESGRTLALDGGAPVKLRYDPENASLRLTSSGPPVDFPLPGGTGVTFALPAEVTDGTEQAIDAVVFHPSGYTTPALIGLSVRGGSALYRVEPFSAAAEEVRP